MRVKTILSTLLSWFWATSAEDENLLIIESWGNEAPELTISSAIKYKVEKQKGPDFDVHIVRSKNPDDPAMGIYIGHHPNPFISRKKGIDIKKEADAVLGQNVEWILWQDKEDGKATYHCETIVSGAFKGMGGGGVAGLMVHVFIKGLDQRHVNLLKTSARSLRIVHK
jgi:hypothetical protein